MQVNGKHQMTIIGEKFKNFLSILGKILSMFDRGLYACVYAVTNLLNFTSYSLSIMSVHTYV